MIGAKPDGSPICRAIGGAFAGAVLGLTTQLALFWDGPPESGVGFPVVGTSVGACLLAVVGIAVGGRAVPVWLARFTVGLVGGAVAGALAGAFIYAPLMAASDPAGNSAFRGKVQASYQRVGVVIGVPLGAASGLLAVGVLSVFRRLGKSTPNADMGIRRND